MKLWPRFKGGCYIWRTRKPGAIFGLPFVGRHFAYIGETVSFHHRRRQHMLGCDKYDVKSKSWNDLDPKCYKIPLPSWKWLLRSVETLLILLTWPVYNDRKNRWNPRRISLAKQHFQRRLREAQKLRNSFPIRFARYAATLRVVHVFMLLIVAVPAYVWMR